MHFLTPHVEISMAENNDNNGSARMLNNSNINHGTNDHLNLQPNTVTATTSSGLDIQVIKEISLTVQL